MKTEHKIIIGDSRCMKEIHSESVHLAVTSPPYWQLKDYGISKQIGFYDTYEDYINNLNLVWKECHRVLHKGCRLCINIGDQFARSVYYGRYKVIPIRTEIIKFCESIGFDYMGAIIWQKVTTCNTTGGATIMGSFPYPRNGIIKLDYEFVLVFKKMGTTPPVSKEVKEHSKLTQEEWNECFSGHWNFSGERQDKHLAMFPEELPKRLIKMFTFVGETVLDPFLGSGTSSLASKNLGRNSVGYEINPEFISIIKKKIGSEQKNFFNDVHIEIIEQPRIDVDFRNEIKAFPYLFKDLIKVEKKIDPKKFQFGSKIDNSISDQNEFYSVKEVLSPDKVLLSNGLIIKLIGVEPRLEKFSEAVNFIQEKTRGQKVFLKYDVLKFDCNNNLMGYLYLRNKTFVNRHLIKSGFVNVDMSFDYKYKQKFISQRSVPV